MHMSLVILVTFVLVNSSSGSSLRNNGKPVMHFKINFGHADGINRKFATA